MQAFPTIFLKLHPCLCVIIIVMSPSYGAFDCFQGTQGSFHFTEGWTGFVLQSRRRRAFDVSTGASEKAEGSSIYHLDQPRWNASTSANIRTSQSISSIRASWIHTPATYPVSFLSLGLFACLSLAVCLCLLLGWAYSCPCSPVGQMYIVQ